MSESNESTNEKPKKRITLSFKEGQWVSRFKEDGDFITIRDMNQIKRVLRVGFREFGTAKRMEKAEENEIEKNKKKEKVNDD